MTALRRSPLLLAVVLALIPAISLAVLIGPLGHHATSPTSVVTPAPRPTAVPRLLSELGLTPQNADASVTATEQGTTQLWHVSYRRQPIEGVAVGFGLFRQTVAEVDIPRFGSVTRVAVDDPALDGGSQYPLRTWQDAWTDVSNGQWFDQCCQVYTGGTVA